MNLDNDLKNKSINIQNSVLFNSFPDQKILFFLEVADLEKLNSRYV